MHYCFFTLQDWHRSASAVRPRDLGAELIERGVEVSYIIEDYPANRHELAAHPKAQVRYVPAKASPRSIVARRRAIRELNPDFVHVLCPSPKAYLSLAGNRRAKVVGDWEEWRAANPHIAAVRRPLERFLDRWLRRRSDLRIVASKYLQKRFAELGHDAAYVPYATYLEDLPPGENPFSEPTAVYMGSFYENYDQDIALRATKLLADRGVTPPIVFVGGGPLLEPWRDWIAEQGLENVTLTGRLPWEELWPRMCHAQVLLFPIRPTIINLARCPAKTFAYAQARRPILTCDVGEVPEVLGEKAEYVEPTPEAFADAIGRWMAQPRPADVNYALERQNWSDRADRLIAAVSNRFAG